MIVYTSRTGNVRSIVGKLGLENVEIKDGLVVESPFFIFTYTDGLGSIPKIVEEFMEYKDNWKQCKGVIVSGNTNFGINYCLAGDTLSSKYNIPIIEKFDLRGKRIQLDNIKQKYTKIME